MKNKRTLFNRSVGAAYGRERGYGGLVRVDLKVGLHGGGVHIARGLRVPGRVAERSARSRRRRQLRRRHADRPQPGGTARRIRGPPAERHRQKDRGCVRFCSILRAR